MKIPNKVPTKIEVTYSDGSKKEITEMGFAVAIVGNDLDMDAVEIDSKDVEECAYALFKSMRLFHEKEKKVD